MSGRVGDDLPPDGHLWKPRRAQVLLVEEDADLRDVVARVLRQDGVDVVELGSSRQLLDILASCWTIDGRRTEPDVIVADVQMQGVSGLKILEVLRETSWAVPVILWTAGGSAAMSRAAERLGAAAVLEKPYDLESLRAAVMYYSQPRALH